MKTTKRSQAAKKRFWRTFALIGIMLGILDVLSLVLTGLLVIAPQWAVALLGLSGVVMALDKWLRWQEDEVEKGKHQVEASVVEWLLGRIKKEEHDAGDAPKPP